MKKHIGLQEKLLLGVIPVIIIIIILLNTVFYSVASKVLISVNDEQRTDFVKLVNAELGNWLSTIEKDGAILSEDVTVVNACRGENQEIARNFLAKVFEAMGIYENVFIADTQGKILLAAKDRDNAEGLDLSTLAPYKENVVKSVQGKIWLSGVNKSPASGRPVMLITVPIKENDIVVGILGTPVELNNFSREYIDNIKVGKRGYAFLADKNGVILAHPDKSLVMKKNLNDFDFGPEMLRIKNGKMEYTYNGEKKVQYIATNEKTGWIISITDSLEDAFLSRLRSMKTIAFFLGLGAVLIVGFVIWWLVHSAIAAIRKVAQKLDVIATSGGDLTQRLEGGGDDEVGMLVKGFNQFMEKLQEIISKVKTNTEELVAASNEISATSTELATGAEEQTSQSSEIAASVQEMTASIVENAKNVNQTSDIAREASSKSLDGKKAMAEAREGSEAVVHVTERAVTSVKSLSDRAGQIGEVIQVIDDIADQTNLLALNAAIEAARAGDQGRGFAVVADEVRKLAERTTKATKEIADTIHAIQSDTEETSESMLEAQSKVMQSVDAVVKTDGILTEITAAVNTMMDMMNQIAAATEEMSSGAEEISKNMESISQVTRESAAGAEQMSIASEEMNRQSEKLIDIIRQFSLGDK